MNFIDVEIVSIAVIVILIIDYASKFKNSFSDNNRMWLIIATSVIAMSIFNIFLALVTNISHNFKFSLIILLYTCSFIPMLGIFYYMRRTFLNYTYFIKEKFKSIFILTVLYLAFLIVLYISIIVIPTNLMHYGNYSIFLVITLIPAVILLFELLYHKFILKRKIHLKIFLIPIICILGISNDIFNYTVTFITSAYALCLIILYISRFDKIMHIDPLTGLYNREFLRNIAFKRNTDNNYVLYMLDIDDFKLTNDKYGHIVGDKVLTDLSLILKNSVRDSDFVIRYGGDEFLIIAITKEEDIEKIPNKINENLIEYNACHEVKIFLSIGSEYVNGRDIETIIKISDKKMYKEKDKHHKEKRK